MTCHRPSARHCSCVPEAPGDDVLLVSTRDPRAAAAVRALASPLAVEVSVPGAGLLEVRGDITALLLAVAAALPAAAIVAVEPGAADVPVSAGPVPAAHVTRERSVPLVQLATRAELVAVLDREIARQGPLTRTGVVFCDVATSSRADGAPSVTVLGLSAARLRATLRRSDTLAHLGDGLFITVAADLPADSSDEVAARTSAAVRACFDEPFAVDEGLLVVAPLVGALVHPGTPEGLAVDGDPAAAPAPTGEDLVAAVERSLARRPRILG